MDMQKIREALDAEMGVYAEKARRETDPRLRERWSGIAVGIYEACTRILSLCDAAEAQPVADISGLVRPIIGVENRTAQEVFDIMCDRIRSALSPVVKAEPVAWRWKRKIDPEGDEPWLSDHDPAPAEAPDAFSIYQPLYASPPVQQEGVTDPPALASLAARTVENDYAEYEGVTAKELAATVARYGKTLNAIVTHKSKRTDFSGTIDTLAEIRDMARAALRGCHEPRV